MSSRKISRKDLLSGCAEPGPGDGVDPRLAPREELIKVPNRKALQLCGQTARTLTGVFAECGDEVLRVLQVESVAPAPNASRLLVKVRLGPAATDVDAQTARQRLANARGMLRAEVAAGVYRRRAPDLVFRIVGR